MEVSIVPWTTCMASLRELITGNPAISAIAPVLLDLAPGSTAVFDILLLIGSTATAMTTITDVFTTMTLLVWKLGDQFWTNHRQDKILTTPCWVSPRHF